MSTQTQTTFDNYGYTLAEKVMDSIALLEHYERLALTENPEFGYYGCDSGGKDSGCIIELAKMAGVTVQWNFFVTGMDPPELTKHIRQNHPLTIWKHPEKHFFKMLAEDRGFPTRQNRWCCQTLKERHGEGKVKISGVRHAESPRRRDLWKDFQIFDPTKNHAPNSLAAWMVNPLIYWSNDDVWNFTREREIPYCELYDKGYKRIGCVGCPMTSPTQITKDFLRWPYIEKAWRHAFHKLWARRHGTTMTRGKHAGEAWPAIEGITNADKLFVWWKTQARRTNTKDKCQLTFS